MTLVVAKAKKFGKMEMFIMAILKMIKKMESENSNLKMGIFMKAIFLKIRRTEEENMCISQAKVMKENGSMICRLVMELKS